MAIPWYQEGSVKDEAFLVCSVGENGAEENGETKAICRIHEGLQRVVELRRWTVRRDAAAEPFYEYYDRFQNLIMELYFDPQTGRGCGIRYYYHFNDNLEKRFARDGFAFEKVETGVWEPRDGFSKRIVIGDDVSKSASGYREIYEYTDDGDYDEQGRLIYQYGYITHGAIDEYYIYEGNRMEPQYRLLLDWGGGGVYVRMIGYDSMD